MDKNAIRSYAIWARNELLKRVIFKAAMYEIEKNKKMDSDLSCCNGEILKSKDIKKRKILIERINSYGFDTVMDEIAYGWFNRFTVLRFMEVNGYLPSKVRVFTDENNRFNPQVLNQPLELEIPGLDLLEVIEYEKKSDREGLFGYIIKTQCNHLNTILPGIFEKKDDYTDLLIPDNLLREGSVISKMVEMIPQEDWKDQVQIIGWLYQYYNIEPKNEVFTGLKKKEKITKEKIPAATQLFTPDWIVKYMVENSLGRLWNECHKTIIKDKLNYYMESAVQSHEVNKKVESLKKNFSELVPEDIKCIDPCVGSGHVLCYFFDILIEIYRSYGYKMRDAVRTIVEKNIYALDIDERAKQLAYFSVMMKARGYDRRFFEREYVPQPNIYTVEESNYFLDDGRFALDYFINGDKKIRENIELVISNMYDAKEYGSIVDIESVDFNILKQRFQELKRGNMSFLTHIIFEKLLPLVNVAEVMSQKYHVVVTNPPYMGGAGMNEKLAQYVKKNYPDSCSDLFAVFIEKCKKMAVEGGFVAMITQHSWMFLSSYEKLRDKIQNIVIENMIHLGPRAFEEIEGEVVQTASFILRNIKISDYKGIYARVVNGNSQDKKEEIFLAGTNRYEISQEEFKKIPGKPVAYWADKNLIRAFETGKKMEMVLDVRQGLATGNNSEFLRLWHEVELVNCKWDSKSAEDLFESGKRWIPYNKGGKYRKWYGNYDYLIKFDRENYEKLKTQGNHLPSKAYYFRESITWGLINFGGFAIRYRTPGGVHDVSGMSAFYNGAIELEYILGLMSTPVAEYVFNMLNPTINLQAGDFKNFPVLIDDNIKEEVIQIARQNIEISKRDWDMYETSWDFKTSPLAKRKTGKIEEAYKEHKKEVNERFYRLKANEERLNEIFIRIYGLEKELKIKISDKNITVTKIFDEKSEIDEEIKGNRYILTCEDIVKNFISYGIGCILGRYSLKKSGVIVEKTGNFTGIIPITEEEYFKDDIVIKFIKFVEEVFGKINLEENLEFIARQLRGKGNARDKIREYFINKFYKDHCKRYEKRPLYWELDSGKKNAIKIFMYIHSYRCDTLAKIRVDYLHELQGKYKNELLRLESMLSNTTGQERIRVGKNVNVLKEKIEELEKFESKVHHIADKMIVMNMDNGVKENYKIFKDILGEIK